jgi:hypothetical protein
MEWKIKEEFQYGVLLSICKQNYSLNSTKLILYFGRNKLYVKKSRIFMFVCTTVLYVLCKQSRRWHNNTTWTFSRRYCWFTQSNSEIHLKTPVRHSQASIHRFWLPLWYLRWRSLQGTLMTLTQASIYRFWLPLWYLRWCSLQGTLMTLTQASIYRFWLSHWYLWWRRFLMAFCI